MTNQRARQTLATIEKALDADETAALSEVIQLIQQLASKAFSISVSELSQLIGRDTTITERVISSANTLGFNPTGQPITTITEAIHTVGFEKIRNLSISILLIENAGRSRNNSEQREAAALAVCSGVMAQQLVGKIRSKLEPELAFVCASLRNYGKLLLSTFLPQQYREANSLGQELANADDAFKSIFGLTPLALGQCLLKKSNLPASIMNTLAEMPPRLLKHVCTREQDEAMALSEVAEKACEVAFNESIPPEDFNQRLMEIVEKYGACIPIGLEMINETFIEVAENMSLFNRTLGLRDADSPATRKLQARLTGSPLPERSPPARVKNPVIKTPAAVEKTQKTERATQASARFDTAIKAIDARLKAGDPIDLREIYDATVNALYECLDLDCAMVFIPEENDAAAYSARYGTGQLFKKVRNRPVVSPKKKDIFSICLARKEDILIQDINAGKIRSVIPDWITENSQTSSFLILPVKTQGILFALMFCGLENEKTIQLDAENHKRLKNIRTQLTRVKEHSENRPNTAQPPK